MLGFGVNIYPFVVTDASLAMISGIASIMIQCIIICTYCMCIYIYTVYLYILYIYIYVYMCMYYGNPRKRNQ